MAARWERRRALLWESTREISEWLVDRLDPQPGQTILELAAGTGETGFLAAARLGGEGRLISSDRSPKMVEAAMHNAAELGVGNAEFRVIDADRMKLGDSSVDGILSRFGYLLKGDPPLALREARRVLHPGGRLAFSVWAARERNPWMTVPAEVMVELGHMPARMPDAGDPFARRSAAGVARASRRGGLRRAGIRGDCDELPLRRRRRAVGVRERAPRPDRPRNRLARRSRPSSGACGDRGPGHRNGDGGFALAGVSLNVVTT